MKRQWLGMASVMLALGVGGVTCYDWDLQSKMPCDDQRECASGFSCLGQECMADHSIPEGVTCDDDVQCERGLICNPQTDVCGKGCPVAAFYRYAAECGTSRYCEPVPGDVEADVEAPWKGVCSEGDDCDACGGGEECVQLTAQVRACLPICEVTFTGTGDYQDTCDHSDPLRLVRCQPVGVAGAQKTVCMEHRNVSPNGESYLCEPANSPCQMGLACVEGTCWPYCSGSGDTTHCTVAGHNVCCPVTGDDMTYNVCKDAC